MPMPVKKQTIMMFNVIMMCDAVSKIQNNS